MSYKIIKPEKRSFREGIRKCLMCKKVSYFKKAQMFCTSCRRERHIKQNREHQKKQHHLRQQFWSIKCLEEKEILGLDLCKKLLNQETPNYINKELEKSRIKRINDRFTTKKWKQKEKS